jgi:phosphoglycolate phosphatase-like HAD superfamily hydrolase
MVPRHTLLALLVAFRFLSSTESFAIITNKELSSSVGNGFRLSAMTDDSASSSSDQFQNLKAIIFDIDGTLADSWKLGYDATQVVLEKNNIPSITAEEYHDFCRYATPERLARHAGLEPDHPDHESVGNKLGAEFDDFYVGLVSRETAGFYDGIDELLKDVPSSIVLGALTNACVDYAHAVFKTNSVDNDADRNYSERFKAVRGADDVPKPKPAPDGLFQVCKDLSLDPSDCVYIGDSPSDGMAAHNAGMPSIGVLWGSHSKEKLEAAPFVSLCETVDELRAALNLVLVK